MAHYYSKVGDQGRTCVIGVGRTGKDDCRVEALGCYDELSSALGVASAFSRDKATKKTLENLQNDMHTVCAEISSYGKNPVKAKCEPGTKKSPECNSGYAFRGRYPAITMQHISEMEEAINRIESAIGKQNSFLIPGGSKESSLIHLARTISRRAERSLVRLSKETRVNSDLLAYANRLSSLLWVLARLQNKINNCRESAPSYRHQA